MRRQLRAYNPLDDYDCESIVIHTGLSVTVRGHLVDLVRDEDSHVATVRVTVIDGHKVTGLEQADVKYAADLLAARAQRFFGITWTVVSWAPLGEAPAAGA